MYKFKIQTPPGNDIGATYELHKDQTSQIFLDAMTVREDVFCNEQGCPLANELDDDDPRSWQWVAYDSEHNRPVGVVRLVPPPHPPHPNGNIYQNEEPYIKLTRVAVLASFRGRGLGKALPEKALAWATKHGNEIADGWRGMVLIHAQTTVEKLYQQLGFQTDSNLGQWDEEGIRHIGMWRRIDIDRD